MMYAVVKYDMDAPASEKELALWIGIDEVIAGLVLDHDAAREDIEERVENALEDAFREKLAD